MVWDIKTELHLFPRKKWSQWIKKKTHTDCTVLSDIYENTFKDVHVCRRWIVFISGIQCTWDICDVEKLLHYVKCDDIVFAKSELYIKWLLNIIFFLLWYFQCFHLSVFLSCPYLSWWIMGVGLWVHWVVKFIPQYLGIVVVCGVDWYNL